MLKYRITLASRKDGEDLAIATVDGTESDYLRLRQFLHNSPVSTVHGTPTEMKWIVTAKIKKPEQWEDVVEDDAVVILKANDV